MSDVGSLYCDSCGNVGFEDGDDGFFYCKSCGFQSQDIIDMIAQGEEAMHNSVYNRSILSQSKSHLKTEQNHSHSQSQTPTLNPKVEKPYSFEDEISVPMDFGNQKNSHPDADELANGVRSRYVQGIQVMIQMQCEVLVEKFGVSAMICGVAGTIWLRFVAGSRVFDEGWANEVIIDSEVAHTEDGEKEAKKMRKLNSDRYRGEPRNLYGERAVMIWFKNLRKKIPRASSLAVCFLACHVAREAILPTDLLKWEIEGKLPYLAAYVDIEKHIGTPSSACPLTSRTLFRPCRAAGAWQLESLAGSIAEQIGLHLPPVNFYAIAHRYLRELYLPIEKILPQACRIFEWANSPDLWLSANPYRLPTRVCVMSILIVAIRILYNIHGFGKWEMSLSNINNPISSCNPVVQLNHGSDKSDPSHTFEKVTDNNGCDVFDNSGDMKIHKTPSTSSSHTQSSELDATELLCKLEKAYENLNAIPDYSKDLPSYLKYCKDVVFAGLTTSYEEESIIEQLWNLYENEEDVNLPVDSEMRCSGLDKKSSRDEGHISIDDKTLQDKAHKAHVKETMDYKTADKKIALQLRHGEEEIPPTGHPSTTLKDKALGRLKSNMEENWFTYIPPRKPSSKKQGYLHYRRKMKDGMLNYVAHADYYILLRACARLVEIDARIMHLGALKLERRLSWIEGRIDDTLRSMPELLDMFSDSDS
ncbi:TATA box-binding protein-associated factor RNA polymerase I subunit B-like isoform X2 [Tasmannia lanceolata]|uniref:TATA box-binding protein-associated factor RNA polymerase I subunit B-like isoform X2 n=1 Tax=Tasmannia lanceolata TaxID=3420 RepID=UPI004063574E